MNIAIIGTGYLGLVTGTCFADIGHHVICFDIDEEKIRLLNQGISPIFEPGLDHLIYKNFQAGRLSFSTDFVQAITNAGILFITVGTPTLPSGEVDLSALKAVAKNIAIHLNTYKLIVVKSTVPIGTNDELAGIIRQHAPSSIPFDIASNPEFLREGSALRDTFEPERIVVGASSEKAFEILDLCYIPLHAPILKVDTRSAEMIKYASNAFLATKISFINEVANLCEKVGADIKEVAEGMGYDYRIGPYFLNAGIGYGGSCLPKDSAALVQMADQAEYDFKILKSVIQVNIQQRLLLSSKIKAELGTLVQRVVSILGLSFKPNTDDIRESPAIDIIRDLLEENAIIRVFDPVAMEKVKKIYPQLYYSFDEYDALLKTDAAVILTDWPQFQSINWAKAQKLMNRKLVFDGRNMFEPKEMNDLGITYHSVGRGKKI